VSVSDPLQGNLWFRVKGICPDAYKYVALIAERSIKQSTFHIFVLPYFFQILSFQIKSIATRTSWARGWPGECGFIVASVRPRMLPEMTNVEVSFSTILRMGIWLLSHATNNKN
jgi:hypothetical protein